VSCVNAARRVRDWSGRWRTLATFRGSPALRLRPGCHGSSENSSEPCAPYLPPTTAIMSGDASHAPRHALADSDRPCRRSLRNEKVRDSSLLSSTIVMSEDMTGRPEPYCGYSGALDVSGLLTDSLPGGGVDDAAVEAVKRCG
jgi:hypothetical protein